MWLLQWIIWECSKYGIHIRWSYCELCAKNRISDIKSIEKVYGYDLCTVRTRICG